MNRPIPPAREDADLAMAWRLFLRRNYRQVMQQLAPQVFLYRDNHRYCLMMGISCLHGGDMEGARTWLQRCEDISPGNVSVAEGLAWLQLHGGNTAEAARLWLQLRDRHPGNRRAGKGLACLREAGDGVIWKEFLAGREGLDLKPLPPMDPSVVARIFAGIAGLCAVAGLVIMIGLFPAPRPAERPLPRGPSAGVTNTPPTDFPEVTWDIPVTHIDEARLNALTDALKTAFNQYRDNESRRIINEILLSDAPDPVKQQIRGLLPFIKEAKFTNFRDGKDFTEVSAAPWLHQGTCVLWKGTIDQVDINAERIRFRLHAGYLSGGVSQGIVPVELGFPVDLSDGMAVELIGRVELDPAPRGAFHLRCSSIRMIRSTR